MTYREGDDSAARNFGPPVIGNETWEWEGYRVDAPSWFEARRLIRLQLENRKQFPYVNPIRV